MDLNNQNQVIEESLPTRPQINSDLIRWMINGDEIANAIEVELTGKTIYNGKEVIVNPNKKPLINDVGINALKILVTSNIGKGPINSNLTDDDVLDIMRDLRRDLNDKLFIHFEDWDVKESDATSIRLVVESNVLFALRRGLNGEELKRWTGAVKRTEYGSPMPSKKGGFLNWMGLN